MKPSHHQQRGDARTLRPQRQQVQLQCLSLDQWLDPQHRVRIVWQFVETLDLTHFYRNIQAVQGKAGRDAVDPRILFTLWLYATIEGVSSGRRITDLTQRDIPYMWICGTVSVNYHLVNDFRTQHADALDALLKQTIAALHHESVIDLETIAQDGMRVRASAGSSSFRREQSLTEALEQATDYVDRLNEQADDDGLDAPNLKAQAARQRAAIERVERLEQAQVELAQLQTDQAKRDKADTKSPRASTTDPQARKMKMPDGGYRPAYNVQFATDAKSRMIVGVDVTQQGTDMGQLAPMIGQIHKDYQTQPKRVLADGGFVKADDIVQLEAAQTQVFAPLPQEQKQLDQGKDPYAKKPGDDPEMAEFRKRMGTESAKTMYKQRSSIAEFANADCRNRGLQQFRVRGLAKVKAQTLWHVWAFNFMRMLNLDCLAQASR